MSAANTILPTTGADGVPSWWTQWRTSYRAGEAHVALLYGDVAGYTVDGRSQRRYLLDELYDEGRIVLAYDLAQGITFPNDDLREVTADREDAKALLQGALPQSQADAMLDSIQQTFSDLGLPGGVSVDGQKLEQGDPFAGVRRPVEALGLLESLLRAPTARRRVAVLVNYADTVFPATDKSVMPPDARTLLVQLLTMASDSRLARQGNPVFLLANTLADIHPDLRAFASGIKAIELPLPDRETRERYIRYYLGRREEQNRPIASEMDPSELANVTAGLSLRQVEDVLLLAARAGGITHALVKARKDDIIRAEYSEIAEMIEPLPGGFSSLGGMDKLVDYFRSEVVAAVRAARYADVPKGVLLVGPPGTGKTFSVRALAQEVGFNAVALNVSNILGGIVGQSEGNLRKFFGFVRSLQPCLVFVDEIDQSNISRRSTNNGDPVAGNLFNMLLQFMSDETLRGKVVMVFASNRPDLLDQAMLRFGRMDAIIPVLLPDEAARRGVITVQATAQGCTVEPEAVERLAALTAKYSSADLAGVVSKARALARRDGGRTQVRVAEVERAFQYIRPNTPRIADDYTLLAIRACNDIEFMPDEWAERFLNPAALERDAARAQARLGGGAANAQSGQSGQDEQADTQGRLEEPAPSATRRRRPAPPSDGDAPEA